MAMPAHQTSGRIMHPPNAWRGAGAAPQAGRPLGRPRSRKALLHRMWREVSDHPAETAPLLR
jgi:hypothetical protein